MKRCPECRRDYYDDTLLYCLEDGTALIQGSVPSPDEPATAILSVPHAIAGGQFSESQTRAQINTTDQTAILPTGAEAEPRGSLGGSTEKRSFSANRAAKPLLAVLAVIIVAGIGFGIYEFAFKKDTAAPSFESMKITKLTDTGKAGSAAISPDGKYVVHVKDDDGQESLWVRHIATGSNVQIMPPSDVHYNGLTLSPDGSYIYFVKREKSEANHALYQLPVLGGEPKKLNTNIISPVTFSPDGTRIAFVRALDGSTTMIIANADGTGEQALATLKSPENFRTSGPAWSPDGKVIATGAVMEDAGLMIIVEVRLEDGTIKPIGSQKWRGIGRVAWLGDGSGMIVSNFELGSTMAQVYQISYPGGEPRKITNDLLSYFDLTLTTDSNSLVTVQEDRVLNIWIAPDGDTTRARQLTRGSGKSEGRVSVRWTPDGRVIYSSFATTLTPVLSIINGDGSNLRQLTQIDSRAASASPDGRYIVFSSLQPGATGTWRMDADGGNPKQLTDNRSSSPTVSPDGRWVVYSGSGSGSGEPGLWKIPIDGGESVRITHGNSNRPAISPDGKSIAYIYRERENSPARIAIVPFDGGQPAKLIDAPPGFEAVQIFLGFFPAIHWLPDGRSLAFVLNRDGVSNIWSMPIDGGAPKQLTNFTTDQIANFDLSRDGKPNLFSRGTTTKDVVLISGFRK